MSLAFSALILPDLHLTLFVSSKKHEINFSCKFVSFVYFLKHIYIVKSKYPNTRQKRLEDFRAL